MKLALVLRRRPERQREHAISAGQTRLACGCARAAMGLSCLCQCCFKQGGAEPVNYCQRQTGQHETFVAPVIAAQRMSPSAQHQAWKSSYTTAAAVCIN